MAGADLLALSVVEREMDDVARALERLDDGTYGTCAACGAMLADEQLGGSPAARFCVAHAPAG